MLLTTKSALTMMAATNIELMLMTTTTTVVMVMMCYVVQTGLSLQLKDCLNVVEASVVTL